MIKYLCLLLIFSFNQDAGMKYFENPREAVEVIRKLLSDKNWELLGQYYSLDGTGFSLKDVIDPGFFLRNDVPEPHHPLDNVQIKRPFDPGFEYNYIEEKHDTINVWLIKKVDQGNNKQQVGIQSFRLIKKQNGLQILP